MQKVSILSAKNLKFHNLNLYGHFVECGLYCQKKTVNQYLIAPEKIVVVVVFSTKKFTYFSCIKENSEPVFNSVATDDQL